MAGGTSKDCGNDSVTREGMTNSASGTVLSRVQSLKSLITSSTSKLIGKTHTMSPTNHSNVAAGPGDYGMRMDREESSSIVGSL